VLAEVNFNLGDYAATQHLLERALREPVDASQRLSQQALGLWTLQRRGETAAAVEQAPAMIEAVPPGAEFDALRAKVLNAAARAAAQTGDARAAAWQSAALDNALRADDIEQQGVALRTLGFLQELNGDNRAALASTTRAAELLAASLGASSPEVFSARNNRGYLLGELGENVQALAEIEALHRDVAAVIPPEHIASIYVDASHAMALRNNGRAAEALTIALDTAQRCIATLGESHMQCGHTMLAVANPLRDLGRPQEAAQWLERLVRNRREGMGADHVYTAYAEQWLARVYCQTGRRDEGLPLATRVAKRFEQELPADNYDRRESLATLALCNAPAAPTAPPGGGTQG
jgi:hypothetical protein